MCIRSTSCLSIRALVVLGNLVMPVSTAVAALITAPGLHLKAYHADASETSDTWPTDPVKCDLILEGDIVDGDAASLKRQFATIVEDSHVSGYSFFLCLRSPGGSVQEALRIARFVRQTQRPSISTVVEDGQTCASACALIFLSGNAPARQGEWPLRYLHPRGRLLYHSSRLNLSGYTDKALLKYLTAPTRDGQGLKGKIADLYSDGLRDMQSVISTFKGLTYQREDVGQPWVRQSLFLEMFAQDPNEWVCIDTIDAVGRWNIQVFGYKPPRKPTRQHHLNVCHNAYHWRSDELWAGGGVAGEGDHIGHSHKDDDIDESDIKRPSKVKYAERNNERGFRLGMETDLDDLFVLNFGAYWGREPCVVEVYFGRSRRFDEEARLRVIFERGGGPVIALYATSYFDASTPLPALPGVRPLNSDSATVRSAVGFHRYQNSLMNGCSYKSIPKIGIDACQAACSKDGACKAYSYNKVRKACDLKHTMSATRLDPMWISGVPQTGPARERSARVVTMTYIYPGEDQRLGGEILDSVTSPSREACAISCESDRTCLAAEYDDTTEQCRRFSSVTGLRKVSVDLNTSSVGTFIKRQQ